MKKTELNIITVDLGTSSVRVGLVSPSLKILDLIQFPVDLITNAQGKAEQDANEIINATLVCIDKIFHNSQACQSAQMAMCFSNAMASLVCLDSDFQPLQLALTYMDLRSGEDSVTLLTTYNRAFYNRTATPIHASYWLPKLLWMNRTGYIDQQCRYYCTIKDLLVFRLTGHFVMDYSNAVATGMCDVTTGDWDPQLMEVAGIAKTQLPAIQPTTTVLKPGSSLPEEFLDFPLNFSIVLGAMDGVLSSLGTGAIKPGQVTTAIGSSGACRIAARSPLTTQESYGVWSYPLDDEIWFRGGAINNGGLVTQWLAETLSEELSAGQDGYEDLFTQAASVQPGADGLIFLPYLYGERAPIYDEHARGVFFGIGPGHTRGHLARAGIEGILFALYSTFKELQKWSQIDPDIWCTGGYIQSDLMLQIQADIFGKPINVPHTPEGSTLGAAMLAFKALKKIESYAELTDLFLPKHIITPNHAAHHIYQEKYPIFIDLYQRLKPLFKHAQR